jgi:hypothetical protein
MDPKAAAAQQAFMQAMVKLDFQYVMLMYKLGCKSVTVHSI